MTSALFWPDPSSRAVAPTQSPLAFSTQGAVRGGQQLTPRVLVMVHVTASLREVMEGLKSSHPLVSCRGEAPSSKKGSCTAREKVKAQSRCLRPVTVSKRSCCQLDFSLRSPPTTGKLQPTLFLQDITAAGLHCRFSAYERERRRKTHLVTSMCKPWGPHSNPPPAGLAPLSWLQCFCQPRSDPCKDTGTATASSLCPEARNYQDTAQH